MERLLKASFSRYYGYTEIPDTLALKRVRSMVGSHCCEEMENRTYLILRRSRPGVDPFLCFKSVSVLLLHLSKQVMSVPRAPVDSEGFDERTDHGVICLERQDGSLVGSMLFGYGAVKQRPQSHVQGTEATIKIFAMIGELTKLLPTCQCHFFASAFSLAIETVIPALLFSSVDQVLLHAQSQDPTASAAPLPRSCVRFVVHSSPLAQGQRPGFGRDR